MTKEVMVTLSGLQLGDSGEDTVETVHIGEYYEKNGVHYLFFDELLEGHKTPIRNMMKLRNEKLEVRKRGPVSAELVFEEGEVTESAYNIPYGSFLVGVHTKGVCLGVEEEKIEMTASYELMVNGAHCSDCILIGFARKQKKLPVILIQKMLSKDRKGLSYDKRKEKETAAKEAFRKKGTCEEAGTQSAGRVAVSVRG